MAILIFCSFNTFRFRFKLVITSLNAVKACLEKANSLYLGLPFCVMFSLLRCLKMTKSEHLHRVNTFFMATESKGVKLTTSLSI